MVGVKLNKKAVGRYSNPLRKFYLEFVSNTPSLQFACCIGDSVQVSWWSFLFVWSGPPFVISGAATLACRSEV